MNKAHLMRGKERYVGSKDVDHHLYANDLRSASCALKKLGSKSTSYVSSIRAVNDGSLGRILSTCTGLSLSSDSS